MNDQPAISSMPRVLLVSPHSSWTGLVAANIEDEFEVVEAHSPEEALEILSTESFNVVTLEFIMPRMCGTDVLEEMHRRNIWTPVIISTSAFRQQDADLVPLPPGVVSWLVHPCTLEPILAMLHATVQRGAERPAPTSV